MSEQGDQPAGPPVRSDEMRALIMSLRRFAEASDRAVEAAGQRTGLHRTDLRALTILVQRQAAGATTSPGDLGRLSEDGHLWLIDRKGDMIISGGYNIYPREVEEVIAEAPGIDEVAVVGVADADWGQRVVALVTARQGAEVSQDLVRDFCASRLAAYKKPKEVRVVSEFPLNSTGKIAKKVLRAQLEDESVEETS